MKLREIFKIAGAIGLVFGTVGLGVSYGLGLDTVKFTAGAGLMSTAGAFVALHSIRHRITPT